MTTTFHGLGLNLGNLSRLSAAETRSISAENPTGAKGQGGRHVDPNHGPSRDLGTGWKVRPCVGVQPGETLVLADVDGAGAALGFASDALYGFDLTRGDLRATLVRASRYANDVKTAPDAEHRLPATDVGEHRFRFVLTPGGRELPRLAAEIVDRLRYFTAHRANYLLDVPPDTSGLLPPIFVERLQEVGQLLRSSNPEHATGERQSGLATRCSALSAREVPADVLRNLASADAGR